MIRTIFVFIAATLSLSIHQHRLQNTSNKPFLQTYSLSLPAIHDLLSPIHRWITVTGERKAITPQPASKAGRQQEPVTILAEKDREISSKQKTIALIVFLMVTKLLFMILAYRYWRKKKNLEIANLRIRNRIRELEHQQHLADERNRIAREMHDDLGTTLTSTLMAVEMIKSAPGAKEPLDMIRRSSEQLSEQINEIVWNLNTNNDNLVQLSSHMLRFAREFLSRAGIKVRSEERFMESRIIIDGYKRRSIHLLLKEMLNNAVKHSGASEVEIDIAYHEPILSISVTDKGNGFDLSGVRKGGNGLSNIKRSAAELNGTVVWNTRQAEGTQVIVEIPL